jgi:hypothetical protein
MGGGKREEGERRESIGRSRKVSRKKSMSKIVMQKVDWWHNRLLAGLRSCS